MAKARAFNAGDWEGFNGCEAWDGADPVLREFEDAVCVVDRHGATAYVGDGVDNNMDIYILDRAFSSQTRALGFLNRLSDQPDWVQLGFYAEE